MRPTDELAGALYGNHAVVNVVTGEASPKVLVTLDELRTLAREAAKQALDEAADIVRTEQQTYTPHEEGWPHFTLDIVLEAIAARAEQIGKGNDE